MTPVSPASIEAKPHQVSPKPNCSLLAASWLVAPYAVDVQPFTCPPTVVRSLQSKCELYLNLRSIISDLTGLDCHCFFRASKESCLADADQRPKGESQKPKTKRLSPDWARFWCFCYACCFGKRVVKKCPSLTRVPCGLKGFEPMREGDPPC